MPLLMPKTFLILDFNLNKVHSVDFLGDSILSYGCISHKKKIARHTNREMRYEIQFEQSKPESSFHLAGTHGGDLRDRHSADLAFRGGASAFASNPNS
jgi:hypothetical protein